MTKPKLVNTTVPCVVCKDGKIVEVWTWQITPDALGRRQYHTVLDNMHCERCGVAYGKLPEKGAGPAAPRES